MLFANWIALIVIFIPWVCAGIAKKAGGFTPNDNHNPRDFLAKAQGVAARANAAQNNSFEILPAFIFVVLLAQLTGNADHGSINFWAMIFLLSRVCFVWAYLTDKALLRTLVWSLGLVAIIALFIVAT